MLVLCPLDDGEHTEKPKGREPLVYWDAFTDGERRLIPTGTYHTQDGDRAAAYHAARVRGFKATTYRVDEGLVVQFKRTDDHE